MTYIQWLWLQPYRANPLAKKVGRVKGNKGSFGSVHSTMYSIDSVICFFLSEFFCRMQTRIQINNYLQRRCNFWYFVSKELAQFWNSRFRMLKITFCSCLLIFLVFIIMQFCNRPCLTCLTYRNLICFYLFVHL